MTRVAVFGGASLRRRLRAAAGGKIEYEFLPLPAARSRLDLEVQELAGGLVEIGTEHEAGDGARRAPGPPREAGGRDRGRPRRRRPCAASQASASTSSSRSGDLATLRRRGPRPPRGNTPPSGRRHRNGGSDAQDDGPATRHPDRRGQDRQLDPRAAQGDRAGDGEDPSAHPVRGLVAADGRRGEAGARLRGRRWEPRGRRRVLPPQDRGGGRGLGGPDRQAGDRERHQQATPASPRASTAGPSSRRAPSCARRSSRADGRSGCWRSSTSATGGSPGPISTSC